MAGRIVYVVYGDGEANLAEALVGPLRNAGYEVSHHGTVMVGGSLVGEAAAALTMDAPVVLCATRLAIGSAWAHQISRAAQVDGRQRVFVVQMEKDAYVEQLALNTKVARYWEDPGRATRELLESLAIHYPPQIGERPSQRTPDEPSINERQHLDYPADNGVVDFAVLLRFRSQLREEVTERLPSALSAGEFLDRACLRIEGRLTRTGALLFAEDPTGAIPSAIVKCTRYSGHDRAAAREAVTLTGTVPDQIVKALDFVIERVRAGEAPTAGSAQATDVYFYPMVAVRELIANALAHRDYKTAERCVHVRLFAERLEISSPGSWLGVKIDDGVEHPLAALEGQSVKRNFRLAHALSWIRLFEGEGSGIPSALRDCRAAGGPEPTVVQEQGFVTVTLRRRKLYETTDSLQTLIPLTLPADISSYVGRADIVAALDSLLLDTMGNGQVGTPVTTINGIAGVGKTALAVHWAHLRQERFPGGILFVDLHGGTAGRAPAAPVEVMRGLLSAFGVPPERIPGDSDSMAMLFRSVLAGRRTLLLLDNASSSEQVQPLIPGDPACTVLVTSRNQLTGLVARGANVVNLQVLSDREALEYLMQRVGWRQVEADPDAAKDLITLCSGLPLALALLAAQAAHRPGQTLRHLLEELDANDRQSILGLGDETISVRRVLSSSYLALSDSAAAVFRLLGVLPSTDIGIGAASAVAGIDPESVQGSLGELARKNLLDQTAPRRYRMHDLLHAYAAELAQQESKTLRSAAMSRAMDYYLHTGVVAAQFLNPRRDPITLEPADPCVTPDSIDGYQQAMNWFSAEDFSLRQIIEEAARLELDKYTWQLAWVLAPFLDVRGHWKSLIDSQTTALAAAERLGDLAAEATCQRFLGRAYSCIDDDNEAIVHYRRALELFQTIDDLHGQANTFYDLAEIRQLRGQYDEALGDAQYAANLYERAGDTSGARDAVQLTYTIAAIGTSSLAPQSTSAGDFVSLPPTPVPQSEPSQTIFIVDVAGFGDSSRTDSDQVGVRRALYAILQDAFHAAGLPLERNYSEDRGDGVLILASADAPKRIFVEKLFQELTSRLGKHNRFSSPAAQIRLRAALHAGAVHQDDHGVAGVDVNRAFRLLESSPLKRALAGSETPLALIISDHFFNEIIRPGVDVSSEVFRRVRIQVKETSTNAWIYIG